MTGNGAHRFAVVPDWGTFPDGNPLGATHGGVAVDRAGLVYVSTDGDRGICVFQPDGTFVRSIALDCSGTHSLVVHDEGGREFLYGAHLRGQRIVKLDLDGHLVSEIKDTPTQPIPGGFQGLTAVTVGPDHRIYAAVGYGSNFLHIFDPAGRLLKSLGGKGTALNETQACHGIGLDLRFGEPRLLVADRENRRLKHYDLEGNLLGIHSTGLRRPCAVSFFGEFCAVAELEGRVTILDQNGVPVAFLGDNPVREQWAKFDTPLTDIPPAVFTAAHGVAYDHDGNLYVEDWNKTGRITKLVRQ